MIYSPEQVGIRLRSLRKFRGLTLREAASQMEMSFSNLCDIEHGNRNMSLDTLVRFSNFYDVSFDFIIAGITK